MFITRKMMSPRRMVVNRVVGICKIEVNDVEKIGAGVGEGGRQRQGTRKDSRMV